MTGGWAVSTKSRQKDGITLEVFHNTAKKLSLTITSYVFPRTKEGNSKFVVICTHQEKETAMISSAHLPMFIEMSW